MATFKTHVVIIGGGLAGLACATRLHQRGIPFVLLEATDRFGGRVRTDYVDGFTLDHGFQVLLTAYPAAQQILDYDALQLRKFQAGALVWNGRGWNRMVDPWRQPWSVLSALMSPVGSFADKLRLAQLRTGLRNKSLEDFWEGPQETIHERLLRLQFSDTIIESFWRPWLAGITLDVDLQTSSRFFEFVFQMFARGDAALPADGMAAIPQQLVQSLPGDALQRNQSVVRIEKVAASEPSHHPAPTRRHVYTTAGDVFQAAHAVIATESPAADRLLGINTELRWRSTACLYFAAAEPPHPQAMLCLKGRHGGLINHLAVMTNVAPEYARHGQALISVNLVGEMGVPENLEPAVRSQLITWFGPCAERWRLLRTYHIPWALPSQPIQRMDPVIKPIKQEEGLWICGDHRETSSIQGALSSGLRVAEAIPPN